MSIASWTSPAASALTFPISWVISSVTSSLCSASNWAKRKSTSPRLGAGASRHPPPPLVGHPRRDVLLVRGEQGGGGEEPFAALGGGDGPPLLVGRLRCCDGV